MLPAGAIAVCIKLILMAPAWCAGMPVVSAKPGRAGMLLFRVRLILLLLAVHSTGPRRCTIQSTMRLAAICLC